MDNGRSGAGAVRQEVLQLVADNERVLMERLREAIRGNRPYQDGMFCMELLTMLDAHRQEANAITPNGAAQ